MLKKGKNKGVFLFVCVFWMLMSLPWVTMRDWFPFLRFGMFSVSPNAALQEPDLLLLWRSGLAVHHTDAGFHAGHWAQLLRTHHYTDNHLVLLKSVAKNIPLTNDTLLYCGIYGTPNPDTVVFARYPVP